MAAVIVPVPIKPSRMICPPEPGKSAAAFALHRSTCPRAHAISSSIALTGFARVARLLSMCSTGLGTAAGLLGVSFCPRSGFTRIDLGPVRSCGNPFLRGLTPLPRNCRPPEMSWQKRPTPRWWWRSGCDHGPRCRCGGVAGRPRRNPVHHPVASALLRHLAPGADRHRPDWLAVNISARPKTWKRGQRWPAGFRPTARRSDCVHRRAFATRPARRPPPSPLTVPRSISIQITDGQRASARSWSGGRSGFSLPRRGRGSPHGARGEKDRTAFVSQIQ